MTRMLSLSVVSSRPHDPCGVRAPVDLVLSIRKKDETESSGR